MKHDAARVRTPLLLLRVKVGLFHLSLLFSECSVGNYSEGLGNEECVVCPPNSEATQTGLTECTCVQDYYRATDEGPSTNCTRECSTSNQYTSPRIS